MPLQILFLCQGYHCIAGQKKQVFNENQQKMTFVPFMVKIFGLGSYCLSHVNTLRAGLQYIRTSISA